MAYPYNKQIDSLYKSENSEFRANAVKEAFQHAWDGYKKYAFPHDELHPVSNGYGNSRCALFSFCSSYWFC